MMGMTFPVEIGNKEQNIILKSSTLNISDYLPDYNVDASFSAAEIAASDGTTRYGGTGMVHMQKKNFHMQGDNFSSQQVCH